jgi:alkyl sulfatase BDS1-like metallo-beta-lactamase superfamily hydrolase
MGVRLNAGKAEGKHLVINWVFSDTGTRYALNLENSALTYSAERNAAAADATLTMTRPTIDAILAQQLSPQQAITDGKIQVVGDARAFGALLVMLDSFRPDFELIAPNPPAK